MAPSPASPNDSDADTFGTVGRLSRFRGPYADGPPPSALAVDAPPLGRFGPRELARMVTIGATLTGLVLWSLLLRLVRVRRGAWASVGAHGLVDGFEALGPTFVKLGQMIALVARPLPRPARRRLPPLPLRGEAVRRRYGPTAGRSGPRPLPVGAVRIVRRLPALGRVDRPGARLHPPRRARRGAQDPTARHLAAHEHRPADHVPAGPTRSCAPAPAGGPTPPAWSRICTRSPTRSSTSRSRPIARTASARTSARSATTGTSPPPRCTGTTAGPTSSAWSA